MAAKRLTFAVRLADFSVAPKGDSGRGPAGRQLLGERTIVTLKEYLTGKSRIAFAASVECSPSRITDLCEATGAWPSRKLALRIRDETGGKVTPNDFLPPFERKRTEQ